MWILIGFIAIGIVLIGLIIFLLIITSNKKKINNVNKDVSKIISLLGGMENISSLNARGSRLTFTLNNKDLFDEQGLKNLGITSIIYMSNKITIVSGSISQDVEKAYLNK